MTGRDDNDRNQVDHARKGTAMPHACRGAEQAENADAREAFEEALSVLDERELTFLEPER